MLRQSHPPDNWDSERCYTRCRAWISQWNIRWMPLIRRGLIHVLGEVISSNRCEQRSKIEYSIELVTLLSALLDCSARRSRLWALPGEMSSLHITTAYFEWMHLWKRIIFTPDCAVSSWRDEILCDSYSAHWDSTIPCLPRRTRPHSSSTGRSLRGASLFMI